MPVKLNVETRGFHALADFLSLMLVDESRPITHEDYTRFLIERYGFEAPLEAALAYTPELDRYIDVRERFRAGFIAQDLMKLGLSASALAEIPQCMIAPFESPAEAFGWLYVHERTTLIFEHVASALERRMPDVEQAMTYLHANRGHIGAAWDDLGMAMDRVAETPELELQIVRAARDAFRMAHRWQVQATIDEHPFN